MPQVRKNERLLSNGLYLAISPGPSPRLKPNFKHTISLLEIASGIITPWLEDPADSLQIDGFLGGDWTIIRAGPPGTTSFRYYLAQWRPTPIPRSEWVEIHPPPHTVYSPTAPFIYGFQNSQFMGMRFDPKKRGVAAQFPVRMPPGSAAEIRQDDTLNVRGPGITFERRQTSASVWLTKLPPN
jgi:hypothetical protein